MPRYVPWMRARVLAHSQGLAPKKAYESMIFAAPQDSRRAPPDVAVGWSPLGQACVQLACQALRMAGNMLGEMPKKRLRMHSIRQVFDFARNLREVQLFCG
jgi:hypothetical protein